MLAVVCMVFGVVWLAALAVMWADTFDDKDEYVQ